jgi:hypothetical protein
LLPKETRWAQNDPLKERKKRIKKRKRKAKLSS